jgi:enterobactin synthetase component D
VQRWTEPPLVLKAGVRARATWDLGAPGPMAGNSRFSDKRMREFTAGRRCAAQALTDAGSCETTVAVGPDRAPVWPLGFVGSITHSGSFAWAAVARSADVRSLGIDSEPIFDAGALTDALGVAFDADERLLFCPHAFAKRGYKEQTGAPDTRGPDRVLATIAYSAKESLYKCLYPCVGVFFDFADARLEWIRQRSDDSGTFGLRLRIDLGSEFRRDRLLVGSYAVSSDHVHTAVELSP